MPNPITLIDGYKLDHRRQYPPGTEFVYSNFTPRTTRKNVDSVVFVGLQYFIKEYIENQLSIFFNGDRGAILDAYQRRMDGYLGPNNIGVDHIADLWDLGYVPLHFRAFPEGSGVPIGVPVLTVENTLPEFFWLVNYIETILSNILWMPITSATTARTYRRILEGYATKTGMPQEFIDFQAHDFSFRGMAGVESAMLSGFGHLTSFVGTDTLPAIDFIERYYMPVTPNYLIGASVAATEHSVMCAGGMESEEQTFERLLDLYPGDEIVSVVSDTWDLWNVCTYILPKLHSKIVGRGGKLVIRPDSGDPVKIICGDRDRMTGSSWNDRCASKGVVELLWDEFGGTVTSEGYKVLDPHVGVIYGDSITEERAEAILAGLEAKGFASQPVLGIGSYTYQYNTRDTHGMAMKATWAQINGVGMNMFKDPITDDGGKKSAKGRLAVLPGENGKPYLVNEAAPEQESSSLLKNVWKDGLWYRTFSIEDIRANVRAS